MRRKTILLLAAALLLLPQSVSGQIEPQEQNLVIFSYERALRMATNDMLVIIDIDELILEIENQRSDLQDDLSLLQSGEWSQVRADKIYRQLRLLDNQLFEAQVLQNQLADDTMSFMQQLLDSVMHINEIGADSLFMRSLQNSIWGMIVMNDLSHNIAFIEAQRFNLYYELNLLSNPALIRDMIEDIRVYIGKLDRQIRSLRLQQEQARLEREYALRIGIVAIKELEIFIDIMKAHIELAEIYLYRSLLRYDFGRLSSRDILAKQRNLAQNRIELTEFERARHNARRSLNLLLGQPLNQNTKVEVARNIPELPDNISSHSRRVATNAPITRIMAIDIEQSREARRLYDGDDREFRDALRRAYDRAVLGRDQTILVLEAATHRSISDLQNLFGRKKLAYIELEHAKSILDLTKHNFDHGRAIEYDILLAYFDVYLVGQNMITITNQMWILEFLVEHPMLESQ